MKFLHSIPLIFAFSLFFGMGCGSHEQDSSEPFEVVLIDTNPHDETTTEEDSESADSSDTDAQTETNDDTSSEGPEDDSEQNDITDESSEVEAEESEDEAETDAGIGHLSGCNDDIQFFQSELWPSVLAPRCAGCHQAGSLAQDSRMVFRTDSSAQAETDNFNAAWVMALYLEEGESLLLRKPSGHSTTPHGGGTLLSESSSEYQRLRHWVQRALDITPCSDTEESEGDLSSTSDPEDSTDEDDLTEPDPSLNPPILSELPPGRRLLRRLSHSEYDASIRVILGEATDAVANLAADNVVNGYSNNADALVVSPLLASQYAELAEELGSRVAYHNPDYQSCMTSESAATCFRTLLVSLGKALFRRPLSNEELQRYFNLWYGIAVEDGEQEATRWAFTAILQSPHFLYRAELGSQVDDGFALTQYEIASQLAFNLTGLPPDDTLLQAAGQNTLLSSEQIMSEAARLIESEAGKAHFGHFLAAWLGLESIETVARNTTLYPEFTPGIRTDMLRQTLKTGATWLERDAAFEDLFTSPLSFVSDDLAVFYGLEPPTTDWDSHGLREILLPETYPAGLLSHGSVLATYAKASASSPIHRGVLVRERILCQELAPPPPNLDTSPPAVDPSQSTRERYSEHASNPACSSCHDLIDPIGFGFEHYDAVGRWRAADGVHSIDASGAILYSPRSDAAFDGLAELGSHLAQSPDVAACFIQQWSEYLYGLHHDDTLEPSVQALKEHFASSSKNLKETLARFIELPHLKVRIEDGTVEEPLYPTNESPLTVLELLQGRTDFNAEPEDNDDDLGNGDDNGILTLAQTEASRWNSGACFDVMVTNQSTVEQTWRVEMPFEWTINNLWNAEIIQTQGNTATIIGLSWNALLAPQASASFGYCVTF